MVAPTYLVAPTLKLVQLWVRWEFLVRIQLMILVAVTLVMFLVRAELMILVVVALVMFSMKTWLMI